MPHGGYHGVIKMGGRVVQDSSGRPPRSSTSSNKTSQDLIKEIKDKRAAATDDFGGSREAFIATQADVARLSDTLRREQEKNLADQVKQSFAQGNVRRSDFTGDAGDKSFFGINYGSTPTAAATVINPFTGERIVTSKVREGMTSEDYANYMRGLRSINPTLMDQTFPVASGAAVRNLARFAPGLGTLSAISGVLGDKFGGLLSGIKKIAQDKGIIPKDTLNAATGTTAETPTDDIISPMAKSRTESQSLMPNIDFLSPQDMGFDAPLGRFVPNPQDMNITAQPGRFVPNPQDMNLQPKMTARDFFDDLSEAEKEYVLGLRQDNPAGMLQTDPNMFTNPATGGPLVFAPTAYDRDQLRGNIPGIGRTTKMTRNMMEQLDPFTNPDVAFVPLKEGGLASINNPQYNELQMASDFDI
tara:strand:- start:38 stop:1282 length:1245 start_codon:yes stop_codon:yes gene_type:complete